MSQKRFANIIVGVIVLAGVAGYFIVNQRVSSPTPVPSPIPSPNPTLTPSPTPKPTPSPTSQELNFIPPAPLTTVVVTDELKRRGFRELNDREIASLVRLLGLLTKDPEDPSLLEEFGLRYGGTWPSHGATPDDFIQAGRGILFYATDHIELRDIPLPVRALRPPSFVSLNPESDFSRQDLNLLIVKQIGGIPPTNPFDWVK